MSEVHVTAGSLDPTLLSNGWVLVVGGSTRPGNRRARRAVSNALTSGYDVLWLDGFEETFPGINQRVPLDSEWDDPLLVILGYASAEAQTLSGRLRDPERWGSNPVFRKVWRVFLRRIGLVLEPRAGWKAVRHDVERLSRCDAPELIVYADDPAVTIAWHAGRIWRNTPIRSSFEKSS